MSEEEALVLDKSVVFYSPKYNLRIEITHPKTQKTDPTAAYYEGAKFAEFCDGLFQTDDPKIIEALDKRNDVFRADDPRVKALEETAHLEPEEREQALKLLEKVGNIGKFAERKPALPSLVTSRGERK
jgi:hypothetical protein